MRLFGRPKRGWSRDGRAWIAVLFLAYLVLGFLAVPRILRWQIPRLTRTYLAREATLRSASFNPFTLTTVLRGFELRDRDGSHLAGFDELTVNLQASGLLRRAWTFHEIHLVHPSVVGRIAADGRPAVADLFEPKAEPEKPKEESRLPRVLIHDLHIDSGTIEFQDESKSPRFSSTLEPLNVRVSGLSTIPDRSGAHSITVGVEDRGEIRWSGRMSVEPLRFEGQLDLTLKRLDRIWDYAGRTIPLQVSSGEAHVSLPYLFEKGAGGALRFEAHDVTFDVAGLAARPRDTNHAWVSLGRVDLKGGRIRWPEKTAEIELVRVSEPAIEAWRSEEGKINWLELIERLKTAVPSGEPGRDAAGASWKASCAAVELAGGSLDIEDRAVAPAVKLAVSGIESRVENLSSDTSVPMKARLSAKVNESATVSAAGTVGLSPMAAEIDVEVAGLGVPSLQSYASQIASVKIQSGAAGVHGKLSYHEGGKPLLAFDGRATLDGLSLADPGGVPVLAWDELAVESIRLTLEPNLFRARAVNIRKPFAQILIDRQGQVGAMKLVKSDGSKAPAAAGPPFAFEIGSIQLHDGGVEYGDESLILPFHTVVHAAEGSLTDLSSKGSAGSRLLIEGKIDEHGYAKAEGTLRVFDPYAASDVHVLFRNVDMTSLTPYTAEFAGYSIKEGRLDLEVDYKIHDRTLLGNHKLTATSLTLGDKVGGAKTSLPLRLAVALLKDSEGKIELEVPIEGSVDDPEFGYRKVIWSAFKRVMINVTTAPFRFLGRLLGIKGDDLEYVSFEAGRSTLMPPEKEKLGKLVEAMKSRPGLALQVGGRFDPVSDAAALRQDKLDALIAARRETMGSGSGDEGAAIDRILEALYKEAFPPEAVEALRKKHTTAPAAPKQQPVFDAAGFFDEIRQALFQAQTVGPDVLSALARARSDAITAALSGEGGIDAARVTATDVQPIKKKEGQELVPCQLAMPVD